MPIYEYECLQCEKHFEVFQSMRDEPIKICDACGGNVRRVIGKGVGVVYKGSGFYSTDQRRAAPQCGKEQPCCGRDVPCDTRPCDE